MKDLNLFSVIIHHLCACEFHLWFTENSLEVVTKIPLCTLFSDSNTGLKGQPGKQALTPSWKITNLCLLPYRPIPLYVCFSLYSCVPTFFYLFVDMSVHSGTGARLFPLWLCLLMSLKTAKLKVPLLVPEGNGSEFDSLTALISVLDTNSGTDAPGQSLVSPELRLTACWQVALWHSVSWLTGWQSRSSSSIDCWDFQGR